MSAPEIETLPDGVLRGVHRVAMCEPDKPWPASMVEELAAELIRLRGTDKIWIAQHPSSTARSTSMSPMTRENTCL